MPTEYRTEDGSAVWLKDSFTDEDGVRRFALERFNGSFDLPVTEVKQRVATGEWDVIENE